MSYHAHITCCHSYCLNSAESHDTKLVKIQQKCVSKETQCSHDCKGKGSPQEDRSHGNQQTSHVKHPQAMSNNKKRRSIRHKKVLLYYIVVYTLLVWLLAVTGDSVGCTEGKRHIT